MNCLIFTFDYLLVNDVAGLVGLVLLVPHAQRSHIFSSNILKLNPPIQYPVFLHRSLIFSFIVGDIPAYRCYMLLRPFFCHDMLFLLHFTMHLVPGRPENVAVISNMHEIPCSTWRYIRFQES